ncbi:MAG: hypothetical protein ACXABD_22050 [Candidatus Thorarchaeota archaeon]|jgi:hypothetical protein
MSSKNIEEITHQELDQAEELARNAMQLKIQKCSDEIEAILDKYRCTIKPSFLVDSTGVKTFINIVPAAPNSGMQRLQPQIGNNGTE